VLRKEGSSCSVKLNIANKKNIIKYIFNRYDRFNKLKNTNPSLKTLLAVGGWNMASAPFTRMVATASGRQEFATSTVKFLRDHNFDGLDLDWEYPANRGSPPGDRHKYGQLLEVVLLIILLLFYLSKQIALTG
jgi:GH18 family chitinase